MSDRRTPNREAPRVSVKGLYDEYGAPITVLPDFVSCDFVRRTYRKVKGEIKTTANGSADLSDPGMVRAKIPYLVTLMVYHSQFQIAPKEQEWFIYAAGDLKSAAYEAMSLWKRWFKPRNKVQIDDMELDFPMLADGVVIEPIDDKFFDESWEYVKRKRHRKAGDPDRPWLFVCLDDAFSIYKSTDRQAGLRHRIR